MASNPREESPPWGLQQSIDGEQRRRQQREHAKECYYASLPSAQFKDETRNEYEQTSYGGGERNVVKGIAWLTVKESKKLANAIVKNRWIEQGIWDDGWNSHADRWDEGPTGQWKHEMPLEVESEDELETTTPKPLFGAPFGSPWPQRRRKSDEELRRIAERRRVRHRDREASRPLHRFTSQVARAYERIKREPAAELPEHLEGASVHEKAYETVKMSWKTRGIWNRGWGVLPGMTWKHEHPLDEILAAEVDPDTNPRPVMWLQGYDPEWYPPTPSKRASAAITPKTALPASSPNMPRGSHGIIFGPPSPSTSDSRSAPVSGLFPSASQPYHPSDTLDPAGLHDGDVGHFLSATNPPASPTESTYHGAPSETEQTSLRKEGASSPREREGSSMADQVLGRVRSAKVDRPPGRNRRGGPRTNIQVDWDKVVRDRSVIFTGNAEADAYFMEK